VRERLISPSHGEAAAQAGGGQVVASSENNINVSSHTPLSILPDSVRWHFVAIVRDKSWFSC